MSRLEREEVRRFKVKVLILVCDRCNAEWSPPQSKCSWQLATSSINGSDEPLQLLSYQSLGDGWVEISGSSHLHFCHSCWLAIDKAIGR